MECNFENCGYYTDGECNICGMGISGEDTFCRLCKDNPNCYYKQNAELKAENDRLKARKDKYYQQTLNDEIQINELYQTLQEIKGVAEPFAKCYTHTCRNCEKYDSTHACCLKDINCYKYNDGSKSSCKDFVLPTKQFYQQILANVITQITKAEEE